MIRHLTDHLANERTFLAWIRTGIAIMAFGFLVERFNIFLSYVGRSLGAHILVHGQNAARLIGVGLIALGIVAMVVSTLRYVARDRDIEAADERPQLNRAPNVILGLLLACIGVFLVAYLLGVGTR